MFEKPELKVYKGEQGEPPKSPNSIRHSRFTERETLRQNSRDKLFLYFAFIAVLCLLAFYLFSEHFNPYVAGLMVSLLMTLGWVIGRRYLTSSQE